MLLCQGAYSQGSDSDLLKVNTPLEPLEPLGIDTSTLPTYLVVATGSIALPTGSVEVLGKEADKNSSSTDTIREDAEGVTEITTTLLTVDDGSTSASALTTTVPISIVSVREEIGSCAATRQASYLLSSMVVVALAWATF